MGTVQTLVLVRDDFWAPLSRWMQEIEVPILEGHNAAMVDLFNLLHARQVLVEFGRAHGRLPVDSSQLSAADNRFLDEAVRDLAQDGKVVCVRLSLFADMMKGRVWTPASLREVGGTAGVGVTFLEESLSKRTAPPAHRRHQQAARAVLQSLLPDSGSDIRGGLKSHAQLLTASGYAHHPAEFDSLLQILDRELRLITPTALEGDQFDGASVPDSALPAGLPSPASSLQYYQLTHDYLVPSLRAWLASKEGQTRQGRADRCLRKRAAVWNAKPEDRNLPSCWEYLNIRLLTRRREWTQPQGTMMRHAGKIQGVRWSIALVMLLVLGFGIERSASAKPVGETANGRGESRKQPRDVGTTRDHRFGGVSQRPGAYCVERGVLAEQQYRLAIGVRICALARVDQVERQLLLDAIATAPSEEVDNLVAALKTDAPDVHTDLRAAASAATAEKAWRVKARLATVAMHLNDLSIAAEVLHAEPTVAEPLPWDPTQRTMFIEHFPTWCGDLEHLGVLDPTNDASLRSGICLAMGSVKEPTVEVKQAWQVPLTKWYVDQPDPGTHSAAGWVLRTWNLPLPAIQDQEPRRNEFHWRETATGLTMIRIPASSVVDVYQNAGG